MTVRFLRNGVKVSGLGVGADGETDIRGNSNKGEITSGERVRAKRRGRKPALHPEARSNTSTYKSWENARQRCRNPRHPQYADYGGRGIRCDISVIDIISTIGPRPGLDYSLERISLDRGYECGNLTWATRREQARNRHTTTFLAHAGERLPIVVWAERLGLSASTISNRLARGWTVERALTTPKPDEAAQKAARKAAWEAKVSREATDKRWEEGTEMLKALCAQYPAVVASRGAHSVPARFLRKKVEFTLDVYLEDYPMRWWLLSDEVVSSVLADNPTAAEIEDAL